MNAVIYSTTYVVTIYSRDIDTRRAEQLRAVMLDSVDSGTVSGFDAFVEPARRWVFPLNRWGSLMRSVLTRRNKDEGTGE